MNITKMIAALCGEPTTALTNTGLDLLAVNTLTVDVTTEVVEYLVYHDLIPATPAEADAAFTQLTGAAPDELQHTWLREELASFGWWADTADTTETEAEPR